MLVWPDEGIPENTLAAFKHALDSSAEIMEFDVWLTSDDKVRGGAVGQGNRVPVERHGIMTRIVRSSIRTGLSGV